MDLNRGLLNQGYFYFVHSNSYKLKSSLCPKFEFCSFFFLRLYEGMSFSLILHCLDSVSEGG